MSHSEHCKIQCKGIDVPIILTPAICFCNCKQFSDNRCPMHQFVKTHSDTVLPYLLKKFLFYLQRN